MICIWYMHDSCAQQVRDLLQACDGLYGGGMQLLQAMTPKNQL